METVLELDKEDLGLGRDAEPDIVEDLKTELLLPVAERDRHLLVCPESSRGRPCKAELSGVRSSYMYVRKHRGPDGKVRLRAAHLPTAYEMTSEERDIHKATKDFLARTAQSAGLDVLVEKASKFRASRPDVTIVGAGGVSLGCEAQFYNASPSTVLRRSRAHAEAALTANWVTHDDRFHLIDRANWMLINKLPWRVIADADDLPLVGGYRVLVEWRCEESAERPCPYGGLKEKTGCGQMHLQWDTPQRASDEGTGWTSFMGSGKRVTVGQILVGAATGGVAPLFVRSRKDRRSGSHLWVPVKDRDKWAGYREVDPPTFEETTEPDDELHFSGRDADTTCQFGEKTWHPSAPLKRRGIDSVELTITVDNPRPSLVRASVPIQRTEEPPVLARRVAPSIPLPAPGICEIGAPKCGKVARLYPGGWRCEQHRPGALSA
ncbi:hypothetical protein [Streptomyces lavendofoliae]|uniref:hypothetical protein n=1 Tax=Streptomyces lavendofoliae TaxID=67314 RepID=UPI0016770210|nr:hypothetical protein [Streptomyces lavendofoliae]